MSILDLHADAAVDAAVSAPKVAPAPAAPKFSAWSAIPRAIGVAAGEIGATLSDAAGAMDYMRRAERLPKSGLPPEALSSELGDTVRSYWKEFKPDPQTASTAEQVLFGAARGMSKVALGAMVGGAPGIVAAGAEEMVTVSDDLRLQGVDMQTRTQAGLVQGGGLAMAALPLLGSTLAQTAGLYVLGGPGGFMAQQALTREILRSGGYDQLAQQYDPFDPVGLAVSALVPAVFTGVAVRGQRIAAKKAADAAMLAGPRPSEPVPVAAAARQVFAPEVQDAARVVFGVEQREASNPAPHTLRTADAHEAALTRAEEQMAAGERVSVADVAPAAPEMLNVWHGSPHLFDAFDSSKIGAGEGAQAFGHGLYFAESQGVAKSYAENLSRTFDPSGDVANYWRNNGGEAAYRKFADEAGLAPDEIAGVVASIQKQGGAIYKVSIPREMVDRMLDWDKPLSEQPTEVRAALERLAPKNRSGQSLLELDGTGEAVVKALGLGEGASEALRAEGIPGIRYLDGNSRRADGEGTRNFVVFPGEEGALRITERNGTPFEQFAAKIAEAVRADAEALSASRGADAAAPVAADSGRAAPAPDAAAPPRAETPGATPGATAEAQAAAARVAEVQAQYPDLQVMLDGMDAPMPMREFLAAVKAEADEMTADAPLYEVAAACALLNGP